MTRWDVSTQADGASAHSGSEDARAIGAPAITPPSNTDGIPKGAQSEVWEDSEELQTDGQEVWLKCKQRQSLGLVFIDWLSFTVRCSGVEVHQTAWVLADRLLALFGGELKEARGNHFYEKSVKLVSGGALLAIIYFGGAHQKNTVHVALPGAAWLSSDESLNLAIYDLMVQFEVAHISRIDLARDCFDGESSYFAIQDAYAHGRFKPSRGVMPSAVKHEDPLRGSTFYVGRRENGKLIRGYEKSMQLSRKQGWFRVEMELRSVNRRIPLEAVLDPAAYFAGACSYLAELADSARVERVKTFQDATLLSLEHVSHHHKVAYGPLVKFLRDIGLTDSQIVDDLTNGVTSKPRRLRIAHEDKVLRVAALAPAVMNT